MSNVFTIMRRDLTAYFMSPIGYIFMMVFITLSVGLYITTFFTYPVADMRPYFDNLPLFFCVFIPAVTMRIWAEERKENTWEMLLTFPMQAWQLVIGKFLAALIFFCLTLFGTVRVSGDGAAWRVHAVAGHPVLRILQGSDRGLRRHPADLLRLLPAGRAVLRGVS